MLLPCRTPWDKPLLNLKSPVTLRSSAGTEVPQRERERLTAAKRVVHWVDKTAKHTVHVCRETVYSCRRHACAVTTHKHCCQLGRLPGPKRPYSCRWKPMHDSCCDSQATRKRGGEEEVRSEGLALKTHGVPTQLGLSHWLHAP